jgi:hypothetical protein
MTAPEAAAPLALKGALLAAWQSQCRADGLVWAVYCRTDH